MTAHAVLQPPLILFVPSCILFENVSGNKDVITYAVTASLSLNGSPFLMTLYILLSVFEAILIMSFL